MNVQPYKRARFSSRRAGIVNGIAPTLQPFAPEFLNALPFLTNLVDRYVSAGIKIYGLFCDEMHIQGDWVKKGHEKNLVAIKATCDILQKFEG